MGQEVSKGPAGHKGTGSNVTGVLPQSKSSSESPMHSLDEYCWATGYWTVQHDIPVASTDPTPFTMYKSNPCADFQGETIVQRLSDVMKI